MAYEKLVQSVYLPYFIAIALLAGACAKVVTPTGGPRDNVPPKLTKEAPANQSVNFNANQIHITFDEFFTLNNPNENVMFSPPLQHQPTYTINGKTLTIKIKDTLRENTTYNVVFSNCIQDYHEGNKLPLYHYSFSTGPTIDSFQMDGKLVNANTLAPEEDFLVLLYNRDIDSLPLTTIPDYVTKSQKNGTFHFQNISPGDYKIFALKDINSNYIYDLPNEAVAFQKGLVSACPPPVAKDSTQQGEASQEDSTTRPAEILLKTFLASDTFPKLLRYDNPEAGVYKFPFSTPVTEFEEERLAGSIDHFHLWNPRHDTLTWYLKAPQFDTLAYLFSANGHTDTVLLKPYKAKTSPTRGGGGGSPKYLRVKFLNEGHRFKPLTLQFSYPILPLDSFPVYIFSQRQGKGDTAVVHVHVPDAFVTEIPIPYNFETKKHYDVMIPDSLFLGYNGLTQDTLRCSFSMKSEKEYGDITLNCQLGTITCPVIVQLFSGTSMIQQDILTQDATIRYEHLAPGVYSLRAILDFNGNGRWDTGDYPRGIQPEPIIPFTKGLSVRAFWDLEEDFKIDEAK